MTKLWASIVILAAVSGCAALPNQAADPGRFAVQFSQKSPVTPVGHEYVKGQPAEPLGWATFPSSAKAPDVTPGWATFPSSAKVPDATPGWATFPGRKDTCFETKTGYTDDSCMDR